MNPYDRRAVRTVWSRVMPGRDVFAPGPWPAPPETGRGGLPPTPPRNPNDNRPPMPPPPGPAPGRRPNLPEPGGWTPPPPPPPPPTAVTQLLELAAGYDALAMGQRGAIFRQMAAQCRRSAATLRSRCGIEGTYNGPRETTLQTQREREAALRRTLEALPPVCAQLAQQLLRESQARSRQLARMR